MKLKKVLIIFLLIIANSFMLEINKVQATLQSNGSTPASKSRDTWMVEVRQMESLGGTLGLLETQNTDLTDSTEESNGLDIHMQKNTEYGAMALLSASSYGKSDKIEDGETTTGNKTGVVIPYNSEWVAAQWVGDTDRIPQENYNAKYINYYSNSINSISGDAFIETINWHSTEIHGSTSWKGIKITGSGNEYGWSCGNYPPAQPSTPGYFLRNSSNGIFSWNNCYMHDAGYGTGWYASFRVGTFDILKSQSYTSRAVIVNGSDL